MSNIKATHLVKGFKHNSPVISCRFDPSGRYIFGGAEDYQIWRWEVATGKKLGMSEADAWVRSLAFADKGKIMISGGYDGRLLFWEPLADKPKPTRKIEAHKGWIRAIAVNNEQSMLATAGNDLVVRLWEISTGKLIRELKEHESHIYNLSFHPNGKHLVTGDLKANIFDWEVATGKKARSWVAKSLIKYDKGFKAFIGGFRGMTFNREGTRLACSGITNVTNAFAGVGNPCVVVYDWKTGKVLIEHKPKQKVKGVAWGVAFHPQGDTICGIGGGSAYLMFWKPKAKQQFHQVKLPSDVRDLHLHQDGVQVATAHHDKHVRIYKMDAKPKKKK